MGYGEETLDKTAKYCNGFEPPPQINRVFADAAVQGQINQQLHTTGVRFTNGCHIWEKRRF